MVCSYNGIGILSSNKKEKLAKIQMNLKAKCQLFHLHEVKKIGQKKKKKDHICSGCLRWDNLTKKGQWKLVKIIKMFLILF